MRRSILLATMFVLAVVCFAPEAHASGVCSSLEAAALAPDDDPNVERVVAIWQRVYAPFRALTGREANLAVLAAGATHRERPLPATGHICPGAPPTVYVTWPMVERVLVEAQYPEDFLAFVFGHELGHRINDLNPAGSILGADERPGRGRHEEELADKRAMFFAARGGYAMQRLAREELVAAFLSGEGLREQAVESRKRALVEALERFDAYENLFQVAIVLAFSNETDTALRLLAHADEQITANSVPLPELSVLRAQTLIMAAAAADPPWLSGLPSSVQRELGALRCTAVFPMHSAFRDEGDGDTTRAAGSEARAADYLRQALDLLERAARLGGPELAIASARTCAHTYLGDAERAREHAAAARALAGKNAPKPVLAALEENDALVAFAAFLARNRPAQPHERTEARAWGKEVKKQISRAKANRPLTAALTRLSTYPDIKPAPTATAPAAATATGACTGSASSGDAPALGVPAIPALPGGGGDTPRAAGTCPDGWTALHTVPHDAAAAGSNLGVTTCAREGEPNTRFVHVRLAASTSPRRAALEATILLHEVEPRATLTEWTCGCPWVLGRGLSDSGHSATLGVCPARNLPMGLFFARPDGRVVRVASMQFGRGDP